MPLAGFAYALWRFYRLIAHFNEPQRRRGHRGRKERSHFGDFYRRCLRRASPTLFLTNHRGAEDTEEKKSDRTLKILQEMPSAGFAYAFLTNRQDAKDSKEEESDRTVRFSDRLF